MDERATENGNKLFTQFQTDFNYLGSKLNLLPIASSQSLPSPAVTCTQSVTRSGGTQSVTRSGSQYPWSVRASSVPLSPVGCVTPFTRSSSAREYSSIRDSDDRDNARKLIQNLVTIFSHSRLPSGSESSRDSSVVSFQGTTDKKTPLSLTSRESVSKKLSFSKAIKTETAVCMFHSPMSSPLPSLDVDSTLSATKTFVSVQSMVTQDNSTHRILSPPLSENEQFVKEKDFASQFQSDTVTKSSEENISESPLAVKPEGTLICVPHAQTNIVVTKDTGILIKEPAVKKPPPTLEGVLSEGGLSEVTLSAVSVGEDSESAPFRKKQSTVILDTV